MKPSPSDSPKIRLRIAGLVFFLASAIAGAVLAVVLNYVLYRIALPSQPFIYVAF
jgi:hypothetical protein